MFDLNNISKAAPLLVRRPAIKDESDIALFKYNSVIITLAPQFGISPINAVIKGPKIVLLRNNFDRNSSPT